MISTTVNKSPKILFYPYETIEIDFGSLLKPISDDEFFDFASVTKIYESKEKATEKLLLCPRLLAKPAEKILVWR
jgi:hypothetical protein